MVSVFFDAAVSDDERRTALYRGDLFVYSANAATRELCDLAREMINEAFSPHDPLTVNKHVSIDQCSQILSDLKPKFIHHPRCKEILPKIISGLGGDPQKVYFDVPRMRSAYQTDFLTSGIAYAFHAHRDTWYSAPMCQLNWWLPIFDINQNNCLAFYPEYFGTPLANSSEIYNYYEWNKKNRVEAAKHVKSDTREQPKLKQEISRQDLRLICPPGGLILFSGSHLHETVPNTSSSARYSIDFRTVHLDDVVAHGGAMNVDSHSTGTTIRDYLRCSDYQRLSPEIVAQYDDGTEVSGAPLIFKPDQTVSEAARTS